MLFKALTDLSKRTKFHFFILEVVILSFFLFGLNPYSKQEQNTLAQIKNNVIRDYNQVIIDDLNKLKEENKAPRASDKIIQSFQERKKLILQQIRENPKILLENQLSNDVLASLPSDISNLVESEETLVGKVFVLKTNFPVGYYRNYYQLKADKTYDLHFLNKPPGDIDGAEVKFQALVLGEQAVIEDTKNVLIQPISTKLSEFSGLQKVIAFRVNFENANAPFTTNQITDEVVNNSDSMTNYYSENSYNNLSYTFEVAGPYAVPYRTTDGCLPGTWANSVKEQAVLDGISVNSYDDIYYSLPYVGSCGWTGLGGGGESWFNNSNDSRVYAHEQGHNYRAAHSSTRDCGSKTIDIYNNCMTSEYGDPFDVMGNATGYSKGQHFNSIWKIKAGFIPPNNVQTVTTSGVYTIDNIEDSTTNTQVLKILKGDTSPDYYYLEYRQAVGFDSTFPSGATQGALLHTWEDLPQQQNSYLLDLSPSDGFTNSAFSDNQAFNDTVNGISIRQVSHNSDSVTLEITVPEINQLDHISIDPSTDQITTTVDLFHGLQFTAIPYDADSHIIPGITSLDWTGADSNGLFKTTTVGVYQVRASYGDIQSITVTITVNPGPLFTSSISPSVQQFITAEIGRASCRERV